MDCTASFGNQGSTRQTGASLAPTLLSSTRVSVVIEKSHHFEINILTEKSSGE
jgi:hypothetical protein